MHRDAKISQIGGAIYVWDEESQSQIIDKERSSRNELGLSKEWLTQNLTTNGQVDIKFSWRDYSYQIITLNVIDTRSPSIMADTNIVMSQDESKTIDLNITGEPVLEITTKDMPDWVTLNGSNQLLFNSGSVAPGTYTFTVDATNEYGSDSIEFNVTIEGNGVEDTTPVALDTTSDAINATPAATTTNSDVKGYTEVLGEDAKTSDSTNITGYIITLILAALATLILLKRYKTAVK